MLLFVPIASAASSAGDIKKAELYKAPENSTIENDLFAELSTKAELYNQGFEKVPAALKKLVASEEIAGIIELENGEMLYVTLLMRGGAIGDFYTYDTPTDPNSKFGPSITVETDEKTVRKILESKEPLKEAVKNMNDGSLQVETEGFFRDTMLWTLQKLYA
ncbi:hypothetical protein [Methanosarcina sp. MSH10X1]|uniref:hypothetical protein n=1 Tax=Methanosarcina sp. MSH10X1 TaxID=2507075 RepID=UPI001F0C4ABF|nr:hypothetical protein [Methanosarcina sp. MSH10X1]